MGLLSGIIKGVSRLGAVMRDLPGKSNRWDLSRAIRKNTTPVQTVTDIHVVGDSWRSHKKRHVSAGAPGATPDINAEALAFAEELAAIRKQTEELQRQNAMLIRALEAGGKYGNAKASSDMVKLANQQRVADAIDKEREESGAEPGTQEWEEARARALDKIRAADLASDFVDHSDPDTQVTLDLTEEEQAALDAMPDNPWSTP